MLPGCARGSVVGIANRARRVRRREQVRVRRIVCIGDSTSRRIPDAADPPCIVVEDVEGRSARMRKPAESPLGIGCCDPVTLCISNNV